jgi:cyclopropane-fatty-acyl-phospholipid synthase
MSQSSVERETRQRVPGGKSNCYHDPEQRFAIVADTGVDVEHVLKMDAYSAATAFVAGQFEVQGDIVAAVRFFTNEEHSAIRSLWHSIAARLGHGSLGGAQRDRTQSLRDIQFHYDRSNEFYAQFLDSRMQYSAADFSDPRRSLEEAQVEKLDRICRALKLRPGERFLDVGCGWGGLIVHAAERFGVYSVGCTLSQAQLEYAASLVRHKGLEGRVSIELKDYHETEGRFAKIASIGMFEHVGKRHLPEYFEQMHSLLEEDGLFLNSGIVRPEAESDGPETLFLQRSVFPGGELEHLADVIREAGEAGFEVQQMKDFRPDYGLTCGAWVARLRQNAGTCCSLVGQSTYRTWLLYLAASCVGFENGTTDAVQILFRKSPRR